MVQGLQKGGELVVGVISDTHGLIRPQALAAFAGVYHIIHAGDIGAVEVLAALRQIAPVTAVRGNNDRFAWARQIPERVTVRIGTARLHVLHDVHELNIGPRATGLAAVIAGHSHRPAITTREAVLFVNPGGAGPRRFTLPVAVARLRVTHTGLRGEVVLLKV